MTNYEFSMWLCGFILLDNTVTSVSAKQILIILNHLNLAKEVDGYLDDNNKWVEDWVMNIIKKKDFSEENLKLFTEKLKKRYISFFKKSERVS